MRPAADLLAPLILAPSRSHPEYEVQVYEGERNLYVCEWYALCDRPATAIVAHPMIGPTLCCESCINRHQMAGRVSDWLVWL